MTIASKPWDRPCCEWADRQRIYLGWYTAPAEWFKPRFHVLRRLTNWLKLVRCRHCSTYWYVGIDTIDDDYYFQRLSREEVLLIYRSKVWPDTFDGFIQFWPDTEARDPFGVLLKPLGFKSLLVRPVS